MNFMVLAGIFSTITYIGIIVEAISDSRKEKREYILAHKQKVQNGYDSLKRRLKNHGDAFYDTLMSVASKMDKLTEDDLKGKLKAYDTFACEYQSGRKKIIYGYIVVDKFLTPRFLADESFKMEDGVDIQLAAALDSCGIKALVKEFQDTKFNTDLEKYRYDTLVKAIK